MSDLITVENDGAELVATNYWHTENAKKGYVYLTVNAGCFRLLVPRGKGLSLDDIKSGKVALVTRGPWPEMGKHDALELLFEDYSDSPFILHIVAEQVDRMPLDSDRDRPGQPPRWKLAVYNESGKVCEMPARYRKAKKLPYMKEWRDDV
jgi:hypothetical protein